MPATYSEIVRRVRLHASTAPLFLVREWVEAAYLELASHRRWSFLRQPHTLVIQPARDLASIVVTQGSTTITSTALFVAGDLGREIRVGTYPYYTITAFTDTSTITIDRAYGDVTDADTPAQVLSAFVTLPADFASFRTITDPTTRRPFPFWMHEDSLLRLDPKRDDGGGLPRALVAASPSPLASTLGRVRYEWYPVSTSARAYPCLYNKQPTLPDDTTTFTGVLADAQSVLTTGALSFAAKWPGTPDVRNPYFNLPLCDKLEKDFAAGIQSLSLRDDEQYGDDLLPEDWSETPPGDLGRSAYSLRSSDADLSDYH